MKSSLRRIVIKFGTGVLSRPGGRALDTPQFRRIAADVSAIADKGHSCVLVSSAAIAAGVRLLGLPGRPDDLPGKQACAAAGQPELMRLYSASFRKHGRHVAQLLLTHGDIDSRTRRENARTTLERLLEAGKVIPIVNENDSVAVEELRFGDNDRLSAEVAQFIKADLLILVTSSDGLQDDKGKRISLVRNVSDVQRYVRPDKGDNSVGGMKTKLEAVKLAQSAGIPSVIVDGRKPGQLLAALEGRDVGTRFVLK